MKKRSFPNSRYAFLFIYKLPFWKLLIPRRMQPWWKETVVNIKNKNRRVTYVYSKTVRWRVTYVYSKTVRWSGIFATYVFTQKQWGEVVYLLKDSNNNEHFAQSTLCWDFQCLFSVNLQLSILIPSLLLLDIYLRETIKTTNNDITERFFPME